VILGGPATVESALVDLIERTATDELMLTSNVADPALRIRTFEQVAQALRPTPDPVA
jgi:hypothetical protein